MLDSLAAQPLFELNQFAEQGGVIIWVLFIVCVLLWGLIVERFWFFHVSCVQRKKRILAQWNARADCYSWRAHKVRE